MLVEVVKLYTTGDGLGWLVYAITATLAALPNGLQKFPILYREGCSLTKWCMNHVKSARDKVSLMII